MLLFPIRVRESSSRTHHMTFSFYQIMLPLFMIFKFNLSGEIIYKEAQPKAYTIMDSRENVLKKYAFNSKHYERQDETIFFSSEP